MLVLLLVLLLMSAKPHKGVLRAMEQHKGPIRMDVPFIPVHGVLHSPPTTMPLGCAGIVLVDNNMPLKAVQLV